jgi:dihydrofolate reductase
MQKNENIILSAIVATDAAGGIGKDGKIPWKCKDDMKHFKAYTMYKTCIMGRITFESIEKYNKQSEKRDLLPGRKLIVLTSNLPNLETRNSFKNLIFVDSLLELKFHVLNGNYGNDICIIGGSSLYEEFSPYYDEVSITEFDADYNCDTLIDKNKIKFNLRFNRNESFVKNIKTDDGINGKIKIFN